MDPTHVRLTIPERIDARRVVGPADALLREIERAFDASITVRGNQISVVGSSDEVDRITVIFSRMIKLIEQGDDPTTEDVNVLIGQVSHGAGDLAGGTGEAILTFKGHAVHAKTEGQKRYVDAILTNTITFGIGPAGTGKTYLAMAMALAALRRHEVSRIVLTRPVVEAGESLGYLPGTLEEKLNPYVRPLYDSLLDLTDREKGLALIEQGIVEIAPLAFMRGRTLNDSFVILDEAQNTTPDQMKMFLTRLGFSSKFVVTGDMTQRDLHGMGGLESARHVLEGLEGISFVDLDRNDIVRHSLVARIVDAYDRSEHGAEASRG